MGEQEKTSLKDDLKTIQNNAMEMTDEALDDTSSVSLLLKNFILSQGEQGHTLWRLKATFGNMSKKNNVFYVETPALVYSMDDGTELHVVSLTGDVDQSNKIMRFIDDVVVTHNDQRLSGDLLVYDGNNKTMTFPDRAFFQDMQSKGAADTVIWHIDTRIIEGEGNIQVTFTTQKDLKSK